MKTKILIAAAVLLLYSCVKESTNELPEQRQLRVVRDYDDKPVPNAAVHFLSNEVHSWDINSDQVLTTLYTDEEGRVLSPQIDWSGLLVEKPGFVNTSFGQNDYQSLMSNTKEYKVRIQQKVSFEVILVNEMDLNEHSYIHVYPEYVLDSESSLNFATGLNWNTERSVEFIGIATPEMQFRVVYDQGQGTEVVEIMSHAVLPGNENIFTFYY